MLVTHSGVVTSTTWSARPMANWASAARDAGAEVEQHELVEGGRAARAARRRRPGRAWPSPRRRRARRAGAARSAARTRSGAAGRRFRSARCRRADRRATARERSRSGASAARVPKSGLASTATTRSRSRSASRPPITKALVVLPTPPLGQITATTFARLTAGCSAEQPLELRLLALAAWTPAAAGCAAASAPVGVPAGRPSTTGPRIELAHEPARLGAARCLRGHSFSTVPT